MDLSGIISIAGKSGLFKMVGQMKNGIIVESLLDGKRFPAYATNKVSALEDISIYGYSEDVPLGEVYDKLYALEEGKPSLSTKASVNEMRARLREAFEDFDEERVYSSDLKKLFAWYNLLLEHGILKPEATEETKEEAPAEEKEAE
jgi:hypothetical protein